MIKTLETERLWLRGVTLADVPAYEQHFVDYEIIRHLSAQVPWPYVAGGVENWLRTVILPVQGDTRWVWGLFLKTDPAHCIGAIDLFREGKPQHRGFWLGRAYWGRGLMTEVATAVTQHAFEELGFERLVFSNARGNERSRRIKEKAGARFLRSQPGNYVDPALQEQELWELTRADWLQHRQGR